MRRVAAFVLLAHGAGCAQLFNLEPLPDAAPRTPGDGGRDSGPVDASPPGCLAENFDSGSWSTQWSKYGDMQGVTVSVVSNALQIDIPAVGSSTASAYGGLYTQNADMTGVTGEAELVAIPTTSKVTEMAVQFTLPGGSNQVSISYNDGLIYMRTDLNSSRTEHAIAYDANAHRSLSLGHDVATNQIVFRARGVGGAWTELDRLPMSLPLTDTYFEVYSGTYDVAPTVSVAFDNVALSGACAN